MIGYIDSSVLLRYLLDEAGQLPEFSEVTYFISSEILRLECLRVLDRIRYLNGMDDDQLSQRREWSWNLLKRFELVQVSSRVLDQASQTFPTPCGSLDAIHLSSALLWQKAERRELVFFTHDRQLGRTARSMGLNVMGDKGL